MDRSYPASLSQNGGRRLNLHAQIVRELGLRIVGGSLRPGETLPNETELGRELGVSRSILREATKSLAAKGLVISRPRVGTQVRESHHWNFLDPDVLGWRYESLSRLEFFRDLFEIRRVVEPAAAALAAEKATPEDMQAIETACADMERADPTSNAAIAADMAFHRAVLTACHNVLLMQMGTLIAVGLHTSFRISTQFYPASLPYHRPVAEAILARDPATAHSTMQELLVETFLVVEHQLSQPTAANS